MPTVQPGRQERVTVPTPRTTARTRTPSPAARTRTPSPAARAGESARRSRAMPALGRPWLRLSPLDRDVLWLYLLTRAGLWITVYCARWLFPSDQAAHTPQPLLAPFQQWDWTHFLNIARDGYFPGADGPWQRDWDNREAFFPGFPLLLRAVHVVVPHWTLAGLLISFLAGAVAVVALARIAESRLPGEGTGRRTVLLLLLSPCAIFLAAGYTEALFLALALPAWLAAQRGNWPLAAVLCALATSVRVSGLFLAAAIAVHFLTTPRRRGHWAALPWLALPALPAGLYSWYLQSRTGDWTAWTHAQERGWYRTFHTPWDAWANTWNGAFDHTFKTGYALMFQAELLAMVIGLCTAGLLVWRRRWPEAVYIGCGLWALGTSYWYMSIPRSMLLWWPLWIALSEASLRRPRLGIALLCVGTPLTTVFAVTFLTGRWAG
ncbi:mannosyltransferase family protein [Streptomyces massasporeus]|uniref:mannosyltransferase family protein n=1 Tax=Streptomyces massasporeus TaxID=67324 RepID=UPI003F51385F